MPEYTEEAFKKRAEGPVVAKCLITETGSVTKCQIIQSVHLMDQAVLDALATWRCKPARRDGKDVAAEYIFRLRLTLPQEYRKGSEASTALIPFDGKTMSRPRLISGQDPVYTKEALANRVQGRFLARCVLTEEGLVTNCLVLRSMPYMDDALLDALMQRRYTPALMNGKPVRVTYVFNLNLVLPGQ